MEVKLREVQALCLGKAAATAQRRASLRARVQDHAAGWAPSVGWTSRGDERETYWHPGQGEAERESARVARGGAARVFVWGHRKRAGREAPEHWTGPQMS